MKQIKHTKGFVLILVISLIPLLGLASLVLTSNSRHILTGTRRADLKTQARLACESGIAWLDRNRQNNLAVNQPLILKMDHPEQIITCTITLISRSDNQSVFTITGSAEDKLFSGRHSRQMILKY